MAEEADEVFVGAVQVDMCGELHPKGRAVSDDEFATVNLTPARFHGGWNDRIDPR